jgi:hypothetical protein
MGKKLSIRSSWTVISCGVPSVAIVVNSLRCLPFLRKCIVSTGLSTDAVIGAAIAVFTSS